MNCWPSGKCVHLLYVYLILGRGSFCFNYCLNLAWHGGDQFVALLRWYEAQVSLTVAFSSSTFFGLLFLLTIHHRLSMAVLLKVRTPVRIRTQKEFNPDPPQFHISRALIICYTRLLYMLYFDKRMLNL